MVELNSMRIIPDWDTYFMNMLGPISSRSKDPNTQVGCVIVGTHNQILSTGYNSLPYGIAASEERLVRPDKYKWIEHGDRNAIYLAARSGTALEGSKMYLTGLPCIDCARGIIQVGIVEVVIDQKRQEIWATTTPKYGPDFAFVEGMLSEAGVKLTRWVNPEETNSNASRT